MVEKASRRYKNSYATPTDGTADVYQQANTAKKSNALTAMSGIFVVPPV
jgi:hypothetical protein